VADHWKNSQVKKDGTMSLDNLKTLAGDMMPDNRFSIPFSKEYH